MNVRPVAMVAPRPGQKVAVNGVAKAAANVLTAVASAAKATTPRSTTAMLCNCSPPHQKAWTVKPTVRRPRTTANAVSAVRVTATAVSAVSALANLVKTPPTKPAQPM